MGESVGIILRAMQRLQSFSDSPLLKSSLWVSTPVDCPPGSPDFVNSVVHFLPRPDETPETLLEKLQELEKEFGRGKKTVLNEPRPLDLDLLVFGENVRNTTFLKLPHPRAHERRFVLQPLAEIAPDLVLPGQTRTVAELLASLATNEQLTRLP